MGWNLVAAPRRARAYHGAANTMVPVQCRYHRHCLESFSSGTLLARKSCPRCGIWLPRHGELVLTMEGQIPWYQYSAGIIGIALRASVVVHSLCAKVVQGVEFGCLPRRARAYHGGANAMV